MNDQLDIYQGTNNLMTTSDISKALGVSESTVLRYIKKTMPHKIVNGMLTLLDESEVTLLKLKLQQNQHLVRPDKLPKTDLEKELLIQQAMQLQAEKIQNLQSQLEQAKPKIDFYDDVVDSSGLLALNETAKSLGTGRTRLCNLLRREGIFLQDKALPYQELIERGYFEVKTTTSNDHIQKQTFVTPKGITWLKRRFF